VYHHSSGPGGQDSNQCLRDLRATDPRQDRARIEGDKDKLRKDCYAWILEDASFQQWRTQTDSRLLWINGDPGKGKTMMTMGVIDELSRADRAVSPLNTMSTVLARLGLGSLISSEPPLLAYFFCQNTRPELNNAISVLRGLIYMLVTQQDQLLRHVQKHYNTVGSKLFERPDVLYTLRDTLSDILKDPTLPMTYLLIDALDECTSGRLELLRIITDDTLAPQSRVKWLVTSRNIQEIERHLHSDSLGVKISLEVSASHVSKAVAAFVDYKVSQLSDLRTYDAKMQAEVQQQLRNKSEGTFLWVSLVCKELEGVPLYRTQEVLKAIPTGLDPLYQRMMDQIFAHEDGGTAQFCKEILKAVTLTFRPLGLRELAVVAGLPDDHFDFPQAVADLVGRCGSFLTVRQDTVSFIHLSAKDYFTSGNGQQVFDSAVAEEQGRVTHRLLNAMRHTLRRDLCGLEKQGARIEGMTEQIQESILPQIAYACEYWVDHLCDSNLTSSGRNGNALHDGGIVDVFLREKFLYWLEATSLCKSMPKGVVSVAKLWSLIQARSPCNTIATALC
jgi:hypothetical protein